MVTYQSPGIIWISPQHLASFKLTLERLDGTVDDITNDVVEFEIEDGVTEFIGRFSFNLWDKNAYRDIWKGMEIFKYSSDYEDSATTLRFRGRIEKVTYPQDKIKITGRSEALKFMDITATQSYQDTFTDQILKGLITTYGSGFTTTNVESSTTRLTVNWQQKPFWECVQELCTAAGFDCYIDSSLDFHFFRSGSRENTDEAIVEEINMQDINEFGDDINQIRNRIIVYGADQDGVQIMYTAEDSSSQTTYGIREEIINDNNLTSYAQAKDYADFRLSRVKDPAQVGEVKGPLLATIQPGQKILLSSIANNLQPAVYDISGYKHKFSDREYSTLVKVNKEPRKLSHVLAKLVENQSKGIIINNPYEMRHSYTFLFDADEGTHTNTSIANGVLKPSGSTGTWISPARVASSTITQAYLILKGTILSGASINISADDGGNYQIIADKDRITFANSGTNLRIKVNFTTSTTEIDSLSILYK